MTFVKCQNCIIKYGKIFILKSRNKNRPIVDMLLK